MLRKIITYFLILAVVLPVLAAAVPLPAGGGVNVAYAEDTTKKGSNDGEISSPCGATLGIFKGEFWDCISYTAVYISYEFFMQIAIWITGLASDIFNVSIQFSLTGKVFDASENGNIMIKDGWTMVRDLLNLVFIFILLFASISTILQYGGFEIKKILPSLVVAALLANFSMMIAKMVIDASHIFAWEFYNQIDVTNGGTVSNMKGSVEVSGDFEKKNLANVFMAGFNPQRLLTGAGMATTTTNEDGEKEVTQSPWKQVAATAMANGEGFTSTLWRMAIIIWLEIALATFASFILLAGAIMFVARIVILWAVIIFSPVAFLSMILPSMGKYSKMWWDYLIGQSFFAPAFLFMFMLTTKFINSGFIDKILHLTKNNDSKVVTGLSMSEMVSIVFSFLIIGGLMSLCLVVARQLGGKTAEFGIKWAHKGKDLALGGALKYVPKPLLRHTVGSISSGIAKSEWAERMAARSPVLGGWMKGVFKKGGDVGGFDKIMEQRIKTGQSLSTPELRAQYLSNLSAREQAEWYKGSSARTRVELEDAALKGRHTTALKNMTDVHKKLSLEEQEKTIKARAEVELKKEDQVIVDNFFERSEEIQKEIMNQMKPDRKSGFVEKLNIASRTSPARAAAFAAAYRPLGGTGVGGVPAKYSSLGGALRKFMPSLAGTIAEIESAVGTHKSDDILLLDKNLATNPDVANAMAKKYNGGHVNKLIERGDDLTRDFSAKLIALGGSNRVADIAPALARMGNNALANWLQTNKTIGAGSLGLV